MMTMKTRNMKYLLLIVCGLAIGTFSSCKLDEPAPIPQEELFLREFIKRYGLIDPQQDWNMAERAQVTVETGDIGAEMINVFCMVGDRYYRVAAYADVEGTVTIPVDVPDTAKKLWVEVDGAFYSTTVGGTVSTVARSRAASRAVSGINYQNLFGDYNYHILDIPTPAGSTVNFKAWGDDKWVYRPQDTESNHVTVTNNAISETFVGAEFFIEFYTKVSYPVPFIFSFDSSTEVNTTLDIAIIDQSSNYMLNQTVTLEPKVGSGDYDLTSTNKQTITLVSEALPPEKWYNLYIKVVSSSDQTMSAATIGNFRFDTLKGSDMAWLLVAEDLGATDDFDFNDVIIRIEALTTNEAFLRLTNRQWQVIEDEEHVVLGAPRRARSRAVTSYTNLKVEAMAAGGILDSYLHFRVAAGQDYILYPGDWDLAGSGDKPTKRDVTTEWHNWFDDTYASSTVNRRNMLWTGLNDNITRRTATLVVPGTFSMASYSQIFSDEDGSRDHIGDNGNTNGDIYNDGNKLSDWNYADNCEIRGFYLTVGTASGKPEGGTDGYYLGASKPGGAPQMFLIPDVGTLNTADKGGTNWHWPRERFPILRVYPRFPEWVNNHLATDWYLDVPVESNISDKEGKYPSSVKPFIRRDND